jgi:hypothetical protein
MSLLHVDIKKFVFPHDVFLNDKAKDKKRRTIYRHYYNYRYSSGENQEDTGPDNFVHENFVTRDVFEQRAIFERVIIKDKESFLNYVVSNETYLGIVSELGPTIRTLVNLAFSSFESKDLKKCQVLIKVGDWGLAQSPIPNPQSPKIHYNFHFIIITLNDQNLL